VERLKDESGSLLPVILGFLAILSSVLVLIVSVAQFNIAKNDLRSLAEECALIASSRIDENWYYQQQGDSLVQFDSNSMFLHVDDQIKHHSSLFLHDTKIVDLTFLPGSVQIKLEAQVPLMAGITKVVSAQARAITTVDTR
jgi:hypothetical protein